MDGAIFIYVIGLPLLLFFVLLWGAILYAILRELLKLPFALKDSITSAMARDKATKRLLGDLPPIKHYPRRPPEFVYPDWWRVEKWKQLLNRDDVFILDTETTGIGENAEVWEVAAIDTTGSLRFHAICQVAGGIPRRAGGSDIFRPWHSVYEQLHSLMQGTAVILAWNASHDQRMLRQTSLRHGLEMQEKAEWRDVLSDYRVIRPGVSHTLENSLKYEGINHIGDGSLHRAQIDCQAVLEVMRAVVRKSEEENLWQRPLQVVSKCKKCGRKAKVYDIHCRGCGRWLG